MARSWHYPRWRRIVMQCAMWVVLAAAVGGAALLNHEVRLRRRVQLDRPAAIGTLRIRLPKGWTRSPQEDRPGVLVRLSSPDVGQGRRQLLILSQPAAAFVPPRVFLDQIDGSDADDPPAAAEQIEIGGYPGVLLSRRARISGDNNASLDVGVVQACTVFPWRQSVEIYLFTPQSEAEEDVDLVRRIAQSLQLMDHPPLSPGQTLQLTGLEMPVPNGWRIAPENDPARLAGQMLYARDGQWLSAEVIPCHIPNEPSPALQAAALRALAAVNGSQWETASVTPEPSRQGTRQWRLELPEDQGFVRQGRIVSDATQRGALVLFRGYQIDARQLTSAWRTMADGLRITPSEDWTAMRQRGARTARQWSTLTLDQLVPTREDQWWLWYGSEPHPYVGWLNLQWLSVAADAAVPWRAVWEARLRPGDGSVIRRRQTVGGSGDLADYSDVLEQWQTGAGGHHFAPAGRSSLRLLHGQLAFVRSAAMTDLRQIPAPSNFVGGGWLPLLIGQSPDQPLILQTESFLTYPADGRLLELVIHPASPPSTRSATQPAGRTLSVQVNGDGDLTRWNFGPDGELQSIQCARGMQLLPAAPQDLRVDFHGDERMSP